VKKQKPKKKHVKKKHRSRKLDGGYITIQPDIMKELQIIRKFLQFLYSHPLNQGGRIEGLSVIQLTIPLRTQPEGVLQMLEFLQDKEFIKYIINDGICDITLDTEVIERII